MTALEILISTFAEMGSTKAMVNLGVVSPEISQRKARDIYGKWFTDAVSQGRLRPCRVEDGRAGTKWYCIQDILALKAADALNQAQLKSLYK